MKFRLWSQPLRKLIERRLASRDFNPFFVAYYYATLILKQRLYNASLTTGKSLEQILKYSRNIV